jgi:hypothetical protein
MSAAIVLLAVILGSDDREDNEGVRLELAVAEYQSPHAGRAMEREKLRLLIGNVVS